ncbi:hypothetical protein V6N13_019833 [Hibiscus sabdariffa]
MTDLTISDIIYPELKTTSRLKYLGTKFHVWRTMLDFVLKDHGVNFVLTQDPSKPNPNDKWVDDDYQAHRLIHETLHKNLYMFYQKHENAKSLMDTLTMDFMRHSASKRFMLFRRYKDYKMLEGSSITQHIIEMNSMAKELELEDEEALRSDNICMRLMNAGDVKEIFKSHDNEESSSRGGFNGNCSSCGEFGHHISDCPN